MINLKINSIVLKKENLQGLMLSFITAVGEVSKGTKKGSFLTQFYRERLNRIERRELLRILNELINQLTVKGKTRTLGESQSSFGEIPRDFQKFFSSVGSELEGEKSFGSD